MIQSKECLSIFFIFPQAFRRCPQAKQYDTVDKQHQLIQQKKRQQKKQKDAAACVPCVVQHSMASAIQPVMKRPGVSMMMS